MAQNKAQPRPKKAETKAKGDSAPKQAPAKPAKTTAKPLTAEDRMNAYGEDAVISALSDGKTMTAIALEVGVTVGQLSVWLSKEDERSARAREARSYAARLWDERAEEIIYQATDPFELNRAKELAHHYRWRAAKIAPRDYGDKVTNEHTGPGGGAIQARVAIEFVQPGHRQDGGGQ